MDEVKRKMSEFELFYHSNNKLFKKLFSDDFAAKFENFLVFSEWYHGAYKKCVKELQPKLHELMLRQYPDFKNITDKEFIKCINTTNESNITGLMFQLNKLYREYQGGINIREKYPKLEEWRAFYSNPQPAPTLGDEWRNSYSELSDEEFKKQQQEEDMEMFIFHNWKEKRKNEYYNIVQPMLFKYLPGLDKIEGDYWVLYAVCVRDMYEEWKSMCEEMEITIDYEMPLESVNWKYEDWKQLASKHFPKYGKISDEKREKRINGEE